MLLKVLWEITGNNNLNWDEDEDILVTYKTVRAYIRFSEKSQYIRFYSPILFGVMKTNALLERINEINSYNGFLHFYISENECVISVSQILATPFISAHVAITLNNYLQVLEEFSNALQLEFGDDDSIPNYLN